MGQTYPLPITQAMLAPAGGVPVLQPRYNTPGDFIMGSVGNDVDVATTTRIAGQTYTPLTQTAKAAAMVPATTVLGDLGKDYGAYTGLTGRTGTITPLTPY